MDELSLTRAHRDHVQRQIDAGRFDKNALGYEMVTFLLAKLDQAIAGEEARQRITLH